MSTREHPTLPPALVRLAAAAQVGRVFNCSPAAVHLQAALGNLLDSVKHDARDFWHDLLRVVQHDQAGLPVPPDATAAVAEFLARRPDQLPLSVKCLWLLADQLGEDLLRALG